MTASRPTERYARGALFALATACLWLVFAPAGASAQIVADEAAQPDSEVQVRPEAEDKAIAARLTRILVASERIRAPQVEVREGIVFLDGIAETEAHRDWAGQVARTTQDVVAVVNRIEVQARVDWDFSPAWAEADRLLQQGQRVLPLLLLATIVLFASWLAARLVTRLSRVVLGRWIVSPLLLKVLTRAIGIPVLLLGLYLVLQFAGLTRLAVTVLGGTGLIGLAIGFAFRDIAENFLASLLLSIRNPFNAGDFIEIGAFQGIVRNLNTRTTVLLTIEGNQVQIPNATVYKSVITNYSASPNRRADFGVGIGYDDPTEKAQEVVSALLRNHEAVKDEPAPIVLVDELAASTVNLRAYFWFDSATYSPDKLRSALMRQTKRALQSAGISKPDEAREVVFPQGVPIRQEAIPANPREAPPAAPQPQTDPEDPNSHGDSATAAEGGLGNEDDEIITEAGPASVPEVRENFLEAEAGPGREKPGGS
ncbi:MAG: mechanosensitive ion channel family protein [Proteobacteria bacterium]|nr:mechanosensitive ion channel family protein [Pseudomonadota bacterium]